MKRRAIGIGLILCLLAITPATAQESEPDLAGTWQTASLKLNRIGYELKLSNADSADTAYSGRLRFKHRDGRRVAPMTVGVAVGNRTKGGYRVTMVLPGGSLASGKGTIPGTLSATDGSMYFPTCSKSLRFAMRGEEDTDCLFQPGRASRR